MSYLRQRINFQSGVVSGTITNSQATISGISFSTAIAAGSAVPVVLNPSYYGSTTSPEIIYVTSVSGTVATVLRAQEGTTAITGTNLPWVAGPLASDFDVSNLTSSGTLTLSGTGGLTVSGTASFNNITTTGTMQVGQNATVTGTLTANSGIFATNLKLLGGTISGSSTIYSTSGAFGSITAGSNSVPFPITPVNGTYVSIYTYPVPSSAGTVANISLSLPAAGTYLITGQLAVSNNAASAASAYFWLTTSGTAVQTNAPVASYISWSAASWATTIPMNGLVTVTGAATLTLYGQASNNNITIVGGFGSTGAIINNIVAVRIA